MSARAGDAVLLYFAYGSNLHPARLGARLTAATLVGTAVLDGWTLRFDKRGRDGSGKGTIAPAADCVHGAVYALHAEDKRRLDRIEGLGAGYDERIVDLPGHGPARTYIAAPDAVDDTLLPFDWYLALVLAGARCHRFPARYLARLASIVTVPDPEPARAAEHARLLAQIADYPPDGCISSPHAAP